MELLVKFYPWILAIIGAVSALVTFNRNRSDNLLVKTQSLQTLVGMDMPKETALGITGLVADNHEVAAAWDKLVAEKEAKERATLPQNDTTETV